MIRLTINGKAHNLDVEPVGFDDVEYVGRPQGVGERELHPLARRRFRRDVDTRMQLTALRAREAKVHRGVETGRDCLLPVAFGARA